MMSLKRMLKNYIKKEGVKFVKEKGIPLIKKELKKRSGKK